MRDELEAALLEGSRERYRRTWSASQSATMGR